MLLETEGFRCQCSGFRILRFAFLTPDTYINNQRACCPSGASFSERSLVGWVKRQARTVNVGFAYLNTSQNFAIKPKLANPTRLAKSKNYPVLSTPMLQRSGFPMPYAPCPQLTRILGFSRLYNISTTKFIKEKINATKITPPCIRGKSLW